MSEPTEPLSVQHAAAEPRMTVVFVRCMESGDAVTYPITADHYSRAIDYALEDLAEGYVEDEPMRDEFENDQDYLAAWDDETRRATQSALDDVEAIRVYAGWPPEGTDDVSGLTLIHEE